LQKDKKDSAHWADKKEVAVFSWQLRFIAFVACYFPAFLKNIIAMVITAFYFALLKKERKISLIYLKKCKGKAGLFDSYKHFLSYSLALLEKFYCWSGRTSILQIETQNDDIGELCRQLENGNGCLIICSHLGNIEYLWSSAAFDKTHVKRAFEFYPIADISVTPKRNELLKRNNSKFFKNILDANSIGPETVAFISEKLAQGNVAIIAGDRVSVNTRSRIVPVRFLGEQAYFPMGAFALACALKVPVYFVFALRDKDFGFSSSCEMHIHKANNIIEGNYLQRKQRIPSLAEEFAGHLEYYCLKHPMQWYNFYDFWAEHEEKE
jgi:predicted LPLAT superfamily acyltransferase